MYLSLDLQSGLSWWIRLLVNFFLRCCIVFNVCCFMIWFSLHLANIEDGEQSPLQTVKLMNTSFYLTRKIIFSSYCIQIQTKQCDEIPSLNTSMLNSEKNFFLENNRRCLNVFEINLPWDEILQHIFSLISIISKYK